MKTPALILLALACLSPRMSTAQFHDTCDTHSLARVHQEAEGKSSLLCQGVADVAMGKTEEGRRILLRVIKKAPRSDAAFEAHERLLGLYARVGKVREASREVSALLAIRPADKDVLDGSSMFVTLGKSPDMSISHLHPTSFAKAQTEGILNIPLSVNEQAATFSIDTGSEISVISDSEARALGLKMTEVSTKVQDIGGTNIPMRVTNVDELDIGAIRLRHVPFIVFPAANPPFNDMPLSRQGLLGIQVAIALQTLRLGSDGRVDVAFPERFKDHTEQLTFDDLTPILHVTYQGKPIPFTFDTGAERTVLYEPFAREFPGVVALGTKKSHNITGVGGTVKDKAIELPTWSIVLGGKTANLDAVAVLLQKTIGPSEWAAGNLGIDALQKVKPFTIDFRAMQLQVGR